VGCFFNQSKNKDTDGFSENDAKVLLDSYYNGLANKDFSQFMGNFPDFYITKFKAEFESSKYGEKEIVQYVYDYYAQTYGSDFNVNYKVTEFDKLGDAEKDKQQEAINKTFSQNIKLDSFYKIKVNEETKGSTSSQTYDLDYFVLGIGDKFYLYDNYYEAQETEESAK
jgi:hypothetical protein